MPEAANSLVRFARCANRYGGRVNVLDNLDLDIAANEKVAIIGPRLGQDHGPAHADDAGARSTAASSRSTASR